MPDAKTSAPTTPQTAIERFDNPSKTPYLIDITCPEFTCLCPKTGQPDFASMRLRYVPEAHCVELKSLKLYLWSFRDRGCFHEAVTHEIADHLRTTLQPRYLRLVGDFYARGGIHTVVRVVHGTLPETLVNEPDPETAFFGRTPGLS